MSDLSRLYVLVTWLDSTIIDRYVPDEDKRPEILPITSVGYLVERTAERVTVARDWHDGVYRGLIAIPAFAVTSVQELTPKVPRKRAKGHPS